MKLQFIDYNATGAEAERKDFLEPDDAIDQIENADTSTTLKQTATMILASVVLRNSLGNTTKLSRLISRPGGASNISPKMMPQQSSVNDRASNQDKSEHPRSAAADADQANPKTERPPTQHRKQDSTLDTPTKKAPRA